MVCLSLRRLWAYTASGDTAYTSAGFVSV